MEKIHKIENIAELTGSGDNTLNAVSVCGECHAVRHH
jgi:hypothetical protein